ncbi:uncharacterized protein RHO17_000972 [Thomomys bottae]
MSLLQTPIGLASFLREQGMLGNVVPAAPGRSGWAGSGLEDARQHPPCCACARGLFPPGSLPGSRGPPPACLGWQHGLDSSLEGLSSSCPPFFFLLTGAFPPRSSAFPGLSTVPGFSRLGLHPGPSLPTTRTGIHGGRGGEGGLIRHGNSEQRRGVRSEHPPDHLPITSRSPPDHVTPAWPLRGRLAGLPSHAAVRPGPAHPLAPGTSRTQPRSCRGPRADASRAQTGKPSRRALLRRLQEQSRREDGTGRGLCHGAAPRETQAGPEGGHVHPENSPPSPRGSTEARQRTPRQVGEAGSPAHRAGIYRDVTRLWTLIGSRSSRGSQCLLGNVVPSAPGRRRAMAAGIPRREGQGHRHSRDPAQGRSGAQTQLAPRAGNVRGTDTAGIPRREGQGHRHSRDPAQGRSGAQTQPASRAGNVRGTDTAGIPRREGQGHRHSRHPAQGRSGAQTQPGSRAGKARGTDTAGIPRREGQGHRHSRDPAQGRSGAQTQPGSRAGKARGTDTAGIPRREGQGHRHSRLIVTQRGRAQHSRRKTVYAGVVCHCHRLTFPMEAACLEMFFVTANL